MNILTTKIGFEVKENTFFLVSKMLPDLKNKIAKIYRTYLNFRKKGLYRQHMYYCKKGCVEMLFTSTSLLWLNVKKRNL